MPRGRKVVNKIPAVDKTAIGKPDKEDEIVKDNQKGLSLRTSSALELVKSRIEMLDNQAQLLLLQSLIEHIKNINLDIKFDDLVTENSNGLFLNLTTCSDEIWDFLAERSSVIEKQRTHIVELEKQRQDAIQRLKHEMN